MGKQASIRLAPPRLPGQKLRIFAHCPEMVAAAGPVTLRVTVNGVAMPAALLKAGDVDLLFPLPTGAELKSAMEVTLVVGHTIHPANDDRELGLPIRVVEIR
jgi:hypothetical protein